VTGFSYGQPFSDGLTQQHTILGTKPAAGAGFSLTLSRHDRWRLVFIYFELTTSNTVADRYVTVDYVGVGGKTAASDGAAVAVEASTTSQPFAGSLNRGNSEWNNASHVFFPLCGIWLEAGQAVAINVANIDTTDQLANIALTFDRTQTKPLEYGDENLEARALNEILPGSG
jgi:hypothetical protein